MATSLRRATDAGQCPQYVALRIETSQGIALIRRVTGALCDKIIESIKLRRPALPSIGIRIPAAVWLGIFYARAAFIDAKAAIPLVREGGDITWLPYLRTY